MNRKIIVYVLGFVIMIEAVLMLLPIGTSLVFREYSHGAVYLGVAAAELLFGFILTRMKPDNNMFYIKEGAVITAL